MRNFTQILCCIWMMAGLSSCTEKSPQHHCYTLTGILTDSLSDGKTIYITRLDDYKTIDTTNINGNQFVFEGVANEPTLCQTIIRPGVSCKFILENGHIVVDFHESKYPKGTKNNEELARINQKEANLFRLFNQGRRQARKEKKSVKDYREEFIRELKEEGLDLFDDHHNDVIGYYLFTSTYMNLLDEEERREVIDDAGPWLQNTELVKSLKEKINNP